MNEAFDDVSNISLPSHENQKTIHSTQAHADDDDNDDETEPKDINFNITSSNNNSRRNSTNNHNHNSIISNIPKHVNVAVSPMQHVQQDTQNKLLITSNGSQLLQQQQIESNHVLNVNMKDFDHATPPLSANNNLNVSDNNINVSPPPPTTTTQTNMQGQLIWHDNCKETKSLNSSVSLHDKFKDIYNLQSKDEKETDHISDDDAPRRRKSLKTSKDIGKIKRSKTGDINKFRRTSTRRKSVEMSLMQIQRSKTMSQLKVRRTSFADQHGSSLSKVKGMKQWYHVESPQKNGGWKKVRRRSHTVAKTQFSVDMDNEDVSVREVTGQRVPVEALIRQTRCCVIL